MQSRLFLSDNQLLQTKCANCRKYLSVPPIIIENNKPVCGRCVQDYVNLEENRANFYENLAKYMFFPCVNSVYGCPVQSPWGHVLAHETECRFMATVCPAIECETKVTNNTIFDHFKVHHNQLILQNNECHLSHITEQKGFANQLIIWKDLPLLVQTKVQKNDMYLRISSFEDIASTLNFKLIINNFQQASASIICLDEFRIQKFEFKLPTFSNKEKIQISSLRNILGPELRCIFNLDDISKSNESGVNNDTMLSELECPVCTEYMTSPIYTCYIGHSICRKCKDKLPKCPSCNHSLGNSRNFTLERIAERVIYPCTNKDQGCDFTGNLKTIVEHNSVCFTCSASSSMVQKKVNCFISDIITCNWKGYYSQFHQHLNLHHDTYYADLRYPITIDVRFQTTVILKYDNTIFKVSVYWDATEIEQSHWGVMCIGNMDQVQDEYMFYLEFVNNKKIFTVNEVCEKVWATNATHSCTKYIDIPFNLLESFVIEDHLIVKLNLVKLK